MKERLLSPETEIVPKLKWLIFFRIFFAVLLIGSSIIFRLGVSPSLFDRHLNALYLILAGIFVLSILYIVALPRVRKVALFAYLQIGIDTATVTLVIWATGGLASIFAILYLLVIITASMIVFRRGSLIMASLCSIQYGIMVNLEYYGVLRPLAAEAGRFASDYPWSFVLYKVLMIILGCFAVSFLSSLLAEQARKTRRELAAMEDHVRRVEKMAAVGEMAAGLAHEIKNPLASLRGSIQVLREDLDYDSGQDRLMRIVMREADRLALLVNNFLLFARPPVGKLTKIELSGALNETVELFEKDGSCRGRIAVEKSFIQGIWVELDPTHLRQVLWNLLINAAEAIEGRGTVSVEMEEAGKRQVVVRISDDGCGMPRETLRSIFDPFFTTKADGTGLGLSIVHRILDSYDSWLDVESEEGAGTTFSLRFRQCAAP
ncbi:MAG: ATP-binding protein [Desulfobacterales bacterium]|jgi:two-component system sensor histidine kinase PilS (NtrC family)